MTQGLTPQGSAWWTPDAVADRQPFLTGRTQVLKALRAWFEGAGFFEVETPILQVSPGNEAHLRAFSTDLIPPDGGKAIKRYLHTSPEFAMKKLLVGGVSPIFQLARVFRNAERASTHHPEFVMLEWYRREADWRDLLIDCRAILQAAATAAGKGLLHRHGRTIDPFGAWEEISVADAFTQHCGIDLLATMNNFADPAPDKLITEAKRIGIRVGEGDRWDDIVLRILGERIEPKLGQDAPAVLYDYPLPMAALARPKPEDPRLAERFEIYVAGLELANGFGELTDATVQRKRFEADMDLKQQLYGERYPIDEDFLAALEFGLPMSAGIALGFDRLVMLATGATHIDQVLWAPVAG